MIIEMVNARMTEQRRAEAQLDMMTALVYAGNGSIAIQVRPKPCLVADDDVIVRITKTTICGTDLRIIEGDLPTAQPGRILGHEGVGVVDEVGPDVKNFKRGDRVLVSCVTACGSCPNCRKRVFSHCRNGGWILGHTIDGTQAEYVRIPHADSSLHAIDTDDDDESLLLCSDILPTGFECGVLDGHVALGSTIAIIGAGPLGLSALLTARLFSPAQIIVSDFDDRRLVIAQASGATHVINHRDAEAATRIMALTAFNGVDTAIEAIGSAYSHALCEKILAPGGRIAKIGTHGTPTSRRFEKSWDRNISITTRLVDTASTPMLLRKLRARKLDPIRLITHRFHFNQIVQAYETFEAASSTGALKVLLET